MIEDFPKEITPDDRASTPAAADLHELGDSAVLDKAGSEVFHTFVAKALFLCKRARPDIQPTVAALCTRTKSPNHDDWHKLIRLLKYLNATAKDKLILSIDDINIIKWHVDSAFAVHPDFKSHTGVVMTMGQGCPIASSRKQKLNTRSSTEAELVATDDMATPMLWTKLFIEAQGHEVKQNVLMQDNKSTIQLLNNGKKSSSKRTRAINIRYFFLTDQIEKGNLTVKYCPTDEHYGDFMSKPLQGAKFLKFKKFIMGH
jgi:hypothetical protein